MQRPYRPEEEGFTLPLIAAMLVIAAMVAATVLQKSNRDEFWDPKVDLQKKLHRISDVLVAYQMEFGRLPCPASRALRYDDANHGVELLTGASDCTANTNITGTTRESTNANMVRVGGLPYKTLGLPREDAEDAWGNQLIYGVTAYYTSATNFENSTGETNGRITVRGVSGTNANAVLSSNAAFVVATTGPDGKGGYKANSTATAPSLPCGGSGDGRDYRNCNDSSTDRTFYIGSTYTLSGNQHNDDQLVWRTVHQEAVDKWLALP